MRTILPFFLLLPACVADPLELAETEQAITPALAPIGTFEIRADQIVYIGHDGTSYRAVELDASFALLRQSPSVAASQPPAVENLATDGTSVMFGDGARTMRLSLAGAAPVSYDPFGIFGKSLRGNGAVTLRDGALARMITGNGFGLGGASPVEVHASAQPVAVAINSTGERAYAVPAGNYLRVVDVDAKTSSLVCKAPATYATAGALASAHDQPKGGFRIVAKLSDGRLAECRRTESGATQMKMIPLPFAAGGVAFDGGGGLGLEGGGGVGFEGGGGLGIWVASASTPELAYVTPAGKVTIYSIGGKTSITPIPIPRVVRSFSDGSAAVLTSAGHFLRVTR